MLTLKSAALVLAAAIALPSQGMATIFSFGAVLDGAQEVPSVITAATGRATLTVDDAAETLSVQLNVQGIGLDDLRSDLVAAPVGPVHIHNAPAGANGPIIVPFAFDSTYMSTGQGFSITSTNLSYASAAATAGSALSFKEFLDTLLAGSGYFNVHTNAFLAGEIRGQIGAVPVPAAGLFGLMGLGALAGLRRRRA